MRIFLGRIHRVPLRLGGALRLTAVDFLCWLASAGRDVVTELFLGLVAGFREIFRWLAKAGDLLTIGTWQDR